MNYEPCCDGHAVFGDAHTIECEKPIEKDEEDQTEIGYDPEPNKQADKIWEGR